MCMWSIKEQIKRVYRRADYVGSLVVPGETGRPTEYDGDKHEPSDWWDSFWKRHKSNTGLTPDDTIMMLKKLFGINWNPLKEKEFERKFTFTKSSVSSLPISSSTIYCPPPNPPEGGFQNRCLRGDPFFYASSIVYTIIILNKS